MAVLIPMPGMLHERGWSTADLNLTVRSLMDLERPAWPQVSVFDAYGILGHLIESGCIDILERIRDTALWEVLPARRAVPLGHPF